MEAVKTANYTIYFNDDGYLWLYENVRLNHYSMVVIITDSNTQQYCLPIFLQRFETDLPIEIIELEPGEENKTIETCTQVWQAMADIGADRKSIVINLGGGVVTDLGGFAASVFKRGIDFINVPTSLLGMVDAAIGGKTGVDLGSLKNQVGTINNPVAILADTAYLSTLSAEEVRSGFAEMLKHGLIYDKNYWESVVNLTNLTNNDLDAAIKRSVEIKTNITEQDPNEKNIRKILNFGHTLGHAIESYFLESKDKKTLLHGEAIAAGMILEAHLSMQKKMLPEPEYHSIKEVLTGIFGKLEISENDEAEIIKLLQHDKKNEFGTVKFVLLQETGKAVINQEADNYLINNAFRSYQN
jgi:3-dehydroquinate synthase